MLELDTAEHYANCDMQIWQFICDYTVETHAKKIIDRVVIDVVHDFSCDGPSMELRLCREKKISTNTMSYCWVQRIFTIYLNRSARLSRSHRIEYVGNGYSECAMFGIAKTPENREYQNVWINWQQNVIIILMRARYISQLTPHSVYNVRFVTLISGPCALETSIASASASQFLFFYALHRTLFRISLRSNHETDDQYIHYSWQCETRRSSLRHAERENIRERINRGRMK